MINQHCPQDPVFGYCKETPDFDIEPTKHPVVDKDGKDMGFWMSGGHCKKDKETCGLFTDHLEIKGIDNPQVRIIKNGKVVTSEEDKKADKDKEKKESAKKKKSAKLQGSLFE